ncbi:hypothetical protein GCM10009616_32990 [Microlunatus lacustris]
MPEPTPTGPSAGLPSTQRPDPFPSSAPPAPTPTADPAGLRVEVVAVEGRSGSLSWAIESVRFSGGPGAAEVNRRVRAAVDDAIRRGKREARDDDGERRITGSSVVTTNDGRTVQVSAHFVDYLAGTASPANHVATTAVTTDEGRPILVSELFRDEGAAFTALARAVRRAADRSGDGLEPDGLAPRRTNWDNWQTSTEGMTVLFDEYQLGGRGIRSYPIAWSVVEPLLTPSARRLLAPR